jgi:monoamine oxidase
MNKIYDYIIAGAGIAGLYTALQLQLKYPTAKICILESSNRIAGRIATFHKNGTAIEAGGARFNNHQHRIINLIKYLKLDKKMIPISSDMKYIPIRPKYDTQLEKLFPDVDTFISKTLTQYIKQNNITDDELRNTTIVEFVKTHFANKYPTLDKYIIAKYPYYSEMAILNAKDGIHLFTNEFSNKTQYYVLAGGLEQMTDGIMEILKSNPNFKIFFNTPITNIKRNRETLQYTILTNKTTQEFTTRHIILAIPQYALKTIKYLTSSKPVAQLINSIQSEALYRVYACYPKNKQTNKVWFANLPKIATNCPIKYIIPINEEEGIIMISYTDAKYADYWDRKVAAGTFDAELTKQLEVLKPKLLEFMADADASASIDTGTLTIPKPKWIRHCHWGNGAGYWKPGVDSKKAMREIIQPFKSENIYICGENYSSHQAWIEGSLETADMVLDELGK